MEQKAAAEEQKWQSLRSDPNNSKAKRNNNRSHISSRFFFFVIGSTLCSVPYNMLTLKYNDSLDGLRMKYDDDLCRVLSLSLSFTNSSPSSFFFRGTFLSASCFGAQRFPPRAVVWRVQPHHWRIECPGARARSAGAAKSGRSAAALKPPLARSPALESPPPPLTRARLIPDSPSCGVGRLVAIKVVSHVLLAKLKETC